MFAPRHEATAHELARALAADGRMGLCSWTPQSAIAERMRALFAYLPPAPEFTHPPPLWGSEHHVAALFADTGLELHFERELVAIPLRSVEDALRMFETKWGPFVQAREQLQPQGRWSALRSDLATVLARHTSTSDGTLTFSSEYLTVVGEA